MNILQITIRVGRITDLIELQKLLVDAISTICKLDYTDQQIKVWISSVENKERWREIFAKQYLMIAQKQNKIVGFCSLDKGCNIDLLYVHKDYQKQGIAYKLYMDIEEEAKRQGQIELTSDVSKTARPFFEKMGFKVLSKQTVIKQGIELNNFKMKKDLRK